MTDKAQTLPMTEQVPTPTPWKVSAGSTHIPGVCKFESIHGMYSNHEANARLIVEAVNSYASLKARVKAMEKQISDARDSLALADKMLSEHIEKFHDFDYEPHQVPQELADLRMIEHHLMGSLILDEEIAALNPEKANG